MNDTAAIGLPEAARHLGVSVRILRRAIRTGRLAAPPNPGATAAIPMEWVVGAKAAIADSPTALRGIMPQKVPAFARYKGTSAWRKYIRRVRAYAGFRAASTGSQT